MKQMHGIGQPKHGRESKTYVLQYGSRSEQLPFNRNPTVCLHNLLNSTNSPAF